MHLKVIKIFIKRFSPSFLPISFTSFYKLGLSLLLFGALSACGNNNDTAPASKTRLAIPTPLQKLANDGGELNAFVVIDGDEANRILMTLNRSGQGSASVTIPRLSRALHNFDIIYEFTNASGTIVLATTSSQADLTSGSDTVTIDANDYDLDIHDEDKDGANNAQELLDGRDPFIPEVPMTISTAIPELNANATGTLRAFVVLDGDTANRIEMDIDLTTSTVSYTFPALFQISHNIVVTFEYTDTNGTIITLANAQRNIDLTDGAVDIDIDVNNVDFAAFDNDGDGVSNAVELVIGSNPRALSPPINGAVASLSYEPIKGFRFTWQDVPGATYYLLQERINVGDALETISSEIAQGTQTFKHIVPLYARINAEYVLQSCNVTGCTDSSVIPVDVPSFVDSIGVLEANGGGFGAVLHLSGDGKTLVASGTAGGVRVIFVFINENDQWLQQSIIEFNGTAIELRLSKNGNTLAISDIGDDSNATGVSRLVSTDTSLIDSGAVHIYVRNAGIWSRQAYVKASNTGATDQFGRSIDLSADGNTLAIGAPNEDSSSSGINGNQTNDALSNSGAVYVFNRSTLAGVATWEQVSYIKASNAGADDTFGQAVSLSADGNTLAAGATGEDGLNDTQDASGAVYIFVVDAFNNWIQQKLLKLDVIIAGGFFGVDAGLSFDGNILIATSSSKAYVYNRDGIGNWAGQVIIDRAGGKFVTNDDCNIFALGSEFSPPSFGINVGANGNGNGNGGGHVRVFALVKNQWLQTVDVNSSQNIQATDYFGFGLSFSGDGSTLAVSSYFNTIELF